MAYACRADGLRAATATPPRALELLAATAHVRRHLRHLSAVCGVQETINSVTRGTGGGRRTHPPKARRGAMGARSGSERGSSKAGWFDILPPGLTRTVELLDSVLDSSSPVVATSSAA